MGIIQPAEWGSKFDRQIQLAFFMHGNDP